MTLTATNATSFTDIVTFSRCPNKYRYRAIVRIQPKKRAAYFKLGSIIHKLFEGVALGGDLTALVYEMGEAIELDPTLFADEKEAQGLMVVTAARIVDSYFEYYQDDWEILHVEETFLIMLESGEVISFTPDLIIRDSNGFVWIVDRKSTDRMPKDGLPFSDLQSLLYYAGVKSMYEECKGFIFDYLRKKEPTMPRLTKTGKRRIADLERIDTTYEIMRNFLETEAPDLLDDLDTRRRMAVLRDDNRFFFRQTIVVTVEQLESVLKDVGSSMTLIKAAHEANAWPRVYQRDGMQACDKCEYREICRAELLQWDTERVLQEHYEPRDDSYKYYPTEEDE